MNSSLVTLSPQVGIFGSLDFEENLPQLAQADLATRLILQTKGEEVLHDATCLRCKKARGKGQKEKESEVWEILEEMEEEE